MSTIYWLQFIFFWLLVLWFDIFTQIVYYRDKWFSSLEPRSYYDFIIVGSGTAGSLIAHRLATETNFSFVVLEAGANSHPFFEIPVLGPLLHGTMFDWNLQTVPQLGACRAKNKQRCRLPLGFIVGGSSKLNNMVHVRGNISHYAAWFHGKYDTNYIKSQFEFVERNILELEDIHYTSELAEAVLDAADELRDYIPGINMFSKTILTQKYGKRFTISDLLDKSNIKTNVLVKNIVFSGDTARWLSVVHDSQNKYLHARKGIILSAGTIHTPKILQLSGIGPANVMNRFGLTMRKDLPVGKNLQDHVTTGLDLIMFNDSLSLSALNLMNPIHMLNYVFRGEGPLTSPGCEVIGFLSTNGSTESDLQFMVLPVGIASDRGAFLKEGLAIKDQVYEEYFVKNFDKHTATILPILLHPESRGEVYIKTSDVSDPITINPRYLSKDNDIKKLIKGLKLIQEFLNTDSMKSIGAYLNPTVFPGCERHEFLSDEYWECYLRHLTLTSYHPVGTCAMGMPTSKNAVVDTSFRVIGFKNLYVADGSVLPTLPSGNINGAVAVMANIFFDDLMKTHMPKSVPNLRNKKCSNISIWQKWINNFCLVKRPKRYNK